MVNAYSPSSFFLSIAVYVYGFGYKGSLLQVKKENLQANSAVFMSRKMFEQRVGKVLWSPVVV